jgi:hypothetical protein
MFKWSCFALAVAALLVFGWMVNDMRLEVKEAGQKLNQHLPPILQNTEKVVQTTNERLPQILEKTERVAKLVNDHLPATLERTDQIAETFAVLAADIKQLKELWAGVYANRGDKSIVAYGHDVLSLIEKQEARIGLKKKVVGKGLKSTRPAQEWVVAARKEAFFLTLVVHSRAELLDRLCKNIFGSSWYIQFGDQPPVKLLDWVKEKHVASKSF